MRLSILLDDPGYHPNAVNMKALVILVDGRDARKLDYWCVTVDTDKNLIVRYQNDDDPGYRHDLDTYITQHFDSVELQGVA